MTGLTAPRAFVSTLTLTSLLSLACAEPPQKEMDQAQGALDAAGAAGAEAYAPTEYREASTALERSHQAVTERDYRAALNYALDARDRAREAARQAADRKAAVRSEAETELATITVRVETLTGQLDDLSAARARAPETAVLRAALDAARSAVEEAREALAREDYLAARDAVDGVLDEIEAAATPYGEPNAPPA